MRQNFRLLILAAPLLGICGISAAQSYPAKSIRMIIPAAPGGAVDTIGRALALKLTEALGQPVVPDNRAGAGTMIASELTAKAPPDGYTLLMMTNSHAINASLRKDLKYDPLRDFAEISLLANSPYLVVVHPSVPAKSVRELIELARQRPGEIYFASAGTASGTHLAGELFAYMAKVKLTHVPYKGGMPGVTDLAGGHVQLMISNLISVMGLVNHNRLRALAITSAQRSPLLPGLPTVAEAGVAGYVAGSWYGALLPAGTPPAIVATLNRELVTAIKSRDVRDRLASEGAEVVGSTPEQFGVYLRNDIEQWRKLVPSLNLRVE